MRDHIKKNTNNQFNPADPVFSRYKDDYFKYGGTITESCSKAIDEYDAVPAALKLSIAQNL